MVEEAYNWRGKVLNPANIITMIRIFLIVPFINCMLASSDPQQGQQLRYTAFGIFVLMGFSDVADGYVARKWDMVSKLGSFLDPLADKLLMLSSCVLLAGAGSAVVGFRLPFGIIAVIIGKDIVLTIGFIVAYALTRQVKIVPSLMGKICTGTQLIMVGATLTAPELSLVTGYWGSFVRLLWILSAVTAFFATLIYIRQGSGYIEEFDKLTQQSLKTADN